ncbi:MAG TPA: hypothetical protein VGH89_09795 [Pseudonocardia sp.]
MVSGEKNARIESAISRARELNDRIVSRAREGGEESIEAYQRMLENVAEAQEAAGDRGAEWVRAFASAQAAFTRQFAEAFPTLLERIGLRAKQVADNAADKAGEVPGLRDVAGEVRGAVSREQDLPIARYDELTVAEINEQLGGLSFVELGRIDAYETRTKNRKTVHDKIASLRR